MAGIADMVDFVVRDFLRPSETVSVSTSGKSSSNSGVNSFMGLCYALSAIVVFVMYDYCWVPSWTKGINAFSFVYFVGSCFQLIGVVSLFLKMKATKTGMGISSQSLGLYMVSLFCRVVTTSIYDGYLPVDRSGDFWVQIVDACSFVVVAAMLYMVNKTYVHSNDEEHDVFAVKPILLGCLVAALFFRADLNRDDLFDVMWAFGMNLEVFQMMPQLYMMTKAGGFVENTTAHYVVNIFIACLCRFAFWIYALPLCPELTETGFFMDMNMGGYHILGAHILEILVMLDFMYYFVLATFKGEKSMHLPKMEGEVI